MKEFIPDFILNNYSNEVYNGEFQAVAMTLDISGFTSITEFLMKKDKEGVEVLNKILSEIFENIISLIQKANGFVSSFAGDAITAIFPDINNLNIPLYSAFNIVNYIKEKSILETKFGKLNISITIGLALGNIQWGIIGSDLKKTYFFKGEAINNCSLAEAISKDKEIIIDKKLYKKVSESIKARKIDNIFYVVLGIFLENYTVIQQYENSYKKELINKFFPEKLTYNTYKGEFRNIVSIFISFNKDFSFKELNIFVGNIIKISNDFGGFFNKILFNPKSGEIFIIFGAPISYDSNIERACNFSLKIIESFPVKIGISYGVAFAGIVGSNLRCEYTAIGNVVNLSSRLKNIAISNQILVSENFKEKAETKFLFEHERKTKIKGFKKDQNIFRLKSKKKQTFIKMSYDGKFFGRSKELKKGIQYCKPIFKGKSGGVIYIYGRAGIGKSRFVYEVIDKLNSNIQFFVLQTDKILKQSMNPLIYFLNNFFKQNSVDNQNDNKKMFENEFNEFAKNIIENFNINESDLERIRSLLASLIGMDQKDSIFNKIELKERSKAVNQALKEFILLLTLQKPLVLLFEDIQWIDNDSKEFVQLLTKSISNYPILIFATSRLNDDDSKPKLITQDIISKEIMLNKLTEKSSDELIYEILKNKPNTFLRNFIIERTSNNPFFIEQYCLYLKESNNIYIQNDKITLKKNINKIPVSINDLLISRIDRLTDELKDTSKLASVLGREFNVKILFELINIYNVYSKSKCNIKNENAKKTITLGISEKLWRKLSELNYIFSHALLHDVIYEMQLKSRLRILHRLIGNIFERLYKDEEEHFSEIAIHYEKADEKEKAIKYYKKACIFLKDKFYNDKALEYAEKALSLCIDYYGEDNFETFENYKNIGIIYRNIDKYNKSILYLEKAIDFFKRYEKKNRKDLLDLYLDIGLTYKHSGNYDKALINYKKAMSLAGNEEKDIAAVYESYGVIYKDKGEYKKSLEYSNKALIIFLKVFGENCFETANIYNNIGAVHLDIGEYDKAFIAYKKTLKIFKKVFNGNHPKIAYVYNNICVYYYYKENYKNSIKYAKKAINILIEIFGENHTDIAYLYNNLGGIFNNIYKFNKSIPLLNKALNIYRNLVNPDHSYISNVYNNLAFVFFEKNNFDKALEYYIKSLKIKIKTYGKDHIEAIFSYYSIANVKVEKGLLNSALALYNLSYRSFLDFYGESNYYTNLSTYKISYIFFLKKDIKKAENYLKKAFDYFNKTSANNYNYAKICELQGDICFKKKQYTKAIEFYNTAYEIFVNNKLTKFSKKVKNKLKKISS